MYMEILLLHYFSWIQHFPYCCYREFQNNFQIFVAKVKTSSGAPNAIFGFFVVQANTVGKVPVHYRDRM